MLDFLSSHQDAILTATVAALGGAWAWVVGRRRAKVEVAKMEAETRKVEAEIDDTRAGTEIKLASSWQVFAEQAGRRIDLVERELAREKREREALRARLDQCLSERDACHQMVWNMTQELEVIRREVQTLRQRQLDRLARESE